MDLYREQLRLEKEMIEEGRNRFLRSISESTFGNTPMGQKILRHFFQPVLESVKNDLKGKRPIGVNMAAMSAVSKLNAEKCVLLTFKVILDNVSMHKVRYQNITADIGSAIEAETRYEQFKADHRKEFFQIEAHAAVYTELYKKHRVFKQAYEAHYQDWEPWDIKTRANLGNYLVQKVCNVTGLLDVFTIIEKTGRRKAPIKYFSLTQEAMQWIEAEIEYLSDIFPAYSPMVVKPIPWEDMFTGGYLSHMDGRVTFVKNHNRSYLDDLNKTEMPIVFDAVNAVQSTPWSINHKVLDVAQQLWDTDAHLDLVDFPYREDLPIKPWPFPDSQKEFSDEEKLKIREWKVEKFKTAKINLKYKSQRLRVLRILSLASKFGKYEEIYFPYNCDFRGRVYPLPLFLNPQGCNLAKGVLQFANGKAIDSKEAVDWLMIHGANCYGYDKVPFKDRLSWVEDHHNEILASASDPYSTTFWMEADSPWQFLAFCFEWEKFYNEGLGYISHLPICVDGSCNGLQHFSAMILDEVGGKSVNLTPSETPQDIYQDVADKVKKSLVLEASDLAFDWLTYGVDRKLTKTPVMVLPYGGTRYSTAEKLNVELMDHYAKTGHHQEFSASLVGAANYMSRKIWDAIEETVQSAPKVMGFLQAIGKLCARSNLPVIWETPSGFKVRQDYPKLKKRRVRLQFLGKHVEPQFTNGKDAFQNPRKAIQGISPNYVHSMDASALHITVYRLLHEFNVKDFMMVHDSYGAHACHLADMSRVLREVFTEMYKSDQLSILLDQVKEYLPEETHKDLPKPPEKGSLDINSVMDSEFFFA